MNLTPRRALTALAVAGALVAPASAASAHTAASAVRTAPAAKPACPVHSYTQPVLVLISPAVTVTGGTTVLITVVNTLPCSKVRLRIYHAGHTVYDKKRTSDVNGRAIFTYKTPTNKNRLLFGGFFPMEATGLSQYKLSNGTYLPFDKKTKIFVL